MSKDFSSQFSSTPELDSLASPQAKIWRWASYLLTASGILLIGMGGWMYYQQYLESIKPPPARIIEDPVAEFALTLTPQNEPTATQDKEPTVAVVARTMADSTAPPAATDIPTLEPTARPTRPSPTPTATATPTTPAEPEPTADESLSLAENPLLVVEDETATQPDLELGPEAEEEAEESESTGSMLTRIVAESIEMDAEVTDVGWTVVMQNGAYVNVWKVADYAAGWHKNSQLPGQDGNVVLSGHHNINGEVFRHIVDLEPGDTVTLYDEAGQQFDYAIEDKFIVKDKGEPEAVRRANARWIGPFNEERLTLVTCWPYNNNTHRVIVIGKPVG